jgi:hypothetical protein
MTLTTVDEGLVAYLGAYSGLTALVSNRVYLMRIPQNATLPCVTVTRISTPRIFAHDTSGKSGTLASPRFQFDAWATTYASAKAINDQIRAALMGHTGTTGTGITIRAALVQDEAAEFDTASQLWRSRSDYAVWHEE